MNLERTQNSSPFCSPPFTHLLMLSQDEHGPWKVATPKPATAGQVSCFLPGSRSYTLNV